MRALPTLLLVSSLATFLACSASPSPPEPTPPAATPEPPPAPEADAGLPEELVPARFAELAKVVDAERLRLGAPAVSIAVVEHGEVTFAKGFGSRNPTTGEGARATTLYRIGSCNKMLTTAAVLQLVAAGKLSLDDTMDKALPGFAFAKDATWAPSMKVRHLLSHTAGQVDYLEVDTSDRTDDALRRFVMQTWAAEGFLMSPSGRMYNYSNPNFYLAGYLVEKASGESYRQYMKAHLFAPLGMTRTLFTLDEIRAENDVASGKTVGADGKSTIVGLDGYENPWARPAGYAVSSVYDMAKFLRFLTKGDDAVLPTTQRVAMQSAQVDTQELGALSQYGFGLEVEEGTFLDTNGKTFYDMRVIGHSGAIPGYAAEMRYVPSLDIGFVTLANTDGAYFTKSFATALRTLATLPAPKPAPTLAGDPAKLVNLAGSFDDPYNVGSVEVTVEGTVVSVKLPKLEENKVKYEKVLLERTANNFLFRVDGQTLPVTFILDANGKAEYLRSRAFVAKRKTEAPPPDAPPGFAARRGPDVVGFRAALERARHVEVSPLVRALSR